MTVEPKKPSRQEISAGIIVYKQSDKGPQFLVLYHGHSYWNFAKGKIESAEDSLEAAFRETEEETGIARKDLRLHGGFRTNERFTFRREGQQVYKTVIFYLAESSTSHVVISDEHSGFGWFPISEARRVLGKYRDSQRVLKQACDFLFPRKQGHGRPPTPQSTQRNNTHGQPHPPKTVVPNGIQRKSIRPHAQNPAWQGGNVRRNRPGPWRPARRQSGGERTQ
jgi:8-oxo-dGTP pyrophosphatase MutT (NUDIX family)